MSTRARLGQAGAAFCAAVILLWCQTARSQVTNPALNALEDEAKQLGAPDWVKEGLRLTYHTASSSNLGGQATAGEGYTEADVVAVAGDAVAVDVKVYVSSADAFGPKLILTTYTGVAGNAAMLGDMWAHPDLLAKAAKTVKQGDAIKVSVGPYEAAGKTFDAVRFEVQNGPGASTTFVYDQKTGLALRYANVQRAGNTSQQTVMTLAARRERKLPWLMGRPPSWLGGIKRYNFTGSMVTEMPGVPPMEIPATATFEVTHTGANFIGGKLSMRVGNDAFTEPTQSVRVSGPSQSGGFWLPPLGLRNLRQGQVIDEDPVTRAKTAVVFVGRADYGREIVTLREDAPGYTSFADYEVPTGMLLVTTLRNKVFNHSISFHFSGKEK